MFGMGPMELLLVFAVILLIFGAKRLPELAQGLGKGIREFKKAMRDETDSVKGSTDVANSEQPPKVESPNKQDYGNSQKK
ncbi:twin-arginine translocase TatA/TatE family subunit [candidate division GN15 bacterium]|uniref:Sec-independent protein translocase protein TatA n=1 Tax=candidate division GN15 bacterium TaxID=2072418 RepID=A0A855X3P6_9BACT|nr:MAG: twin-arginine translocase TatA/TatE family subunit [candidate division GN15 bacterium]